MLCDYILLLVDIFGFFLVHIPFTQIYDVVLLMRGHETREIKSNKIEVRIFCDVTITIHNVTNSFTIQYTYL